MLAADQVALDVHWIVRTCAPGLPERTALIREVPARVISWSSHQGQAMSPGPAPLGRSVFVKDSDVPPVPFRITHPLALARNSVFAAPKKAKGKGSVWTADEPLSTQVGP